MSDDKKIFQFDLNRKNKPSIIQEDIDDEELIGIDLPSFTPFIPGLFKYITLINKAGNTTALIFSNDADLTSIHYTLEDTFEGFSIHTGGYFSVIDSVITVCGRLTELPLDPIPMRDSVILGITLGKMQYLCKQQFSKH